MLIISINFGVNIRADSITIRYYKKHTKSIQKAYKKHTKSIQKAYKKQGGWGRRGNLGFPTYFPFLTSISTSICILYINEKC